MTVMPAQATRWAAAGALAVVALSGCSPSEADSPPPAATTEVTITAPTTPTATTPASATPTLTDEEETAALAAMDVLEAFEDVVTRSYLDPAQDWTAEYGTVSGDPLRSSLLNTVRALRDNAIIYEGRAVVEDSVVEEVQLEPFGQVTIRACHDVSGWTAIDTATGEVFTHPDQPDRFPLSSIVTQYEDGRWLVSDSMPYLDQSC
ncbi:hypothetical protein BH20ACT5_BH20ACT5_08850 [soil metagenome]